MRFVLRLNLVTSLTRLLLRYVLKAFFSYLLYQGLLRNPDLSGKSHDTHKMSRKKKVPWIGCVHLLTSIKLPHIQCGGPDGVVDITPLPETCVESHW